MKIPFLANWREKLGQLAKQLQSKNIKMDLRGLNLKIDDTKLAQLKRLAAERPKFSLQGSIDQSRVLIREMPARLKELREMKPSDLKNVRVSRKAFIYFGLALLISSAAYAAIGPAGSSTQVAPAKPASPVSDLNEELPASRPQPQPVAEPAPQPISEPVMNQPSSQPLNAMNPAADQAATSPTPAPTARPLGPECQHICERVRSKMHGHSAQIAQEYQLWQMRLGVKSDIIHYPQGYTAAEEMLEFMATYYVTKAPENQMDPSFLTFMMGKCFPETYIDTDRARLSGLVNTIWLAQNFKLRHEQEALTSCQ